MDQFTVSDFINYNKTCFMCGNKSNIEYILNIEDEHDSHALITDFYKSKSDTSLKITYNSKLNFQIDFITNRFTSSSNDMLYQFLLVNNISINSMCINNGYTCSSVCSSKLNFNFIDNFIKPIHIEYELFSHRGNSIYQLHSDYIKNSSKIIICENDHSSNEVLNLNTKLLPRKNFKNKQELLDKLKLYALLS